MTPELQKQIEQEAIERYGDKPGGTQSLQRACYKKGAKKYADLWQAAEASIKTCGDVIAKLNNSLTNTEAALKEADQRAERAEKALREIRKWELATGAKIKVKHLDILKDIMQTVNNALTPKTSTGEHS